MKDKELTIDEKQFLLYASRGDTVSLKRILEYYCDEKKDEFTNINGEFDINCVDPLGRSALIIAIENENITLIELLLNYKIKPKDALLHAINEEFVEAVEILLQFEDLIHRSENSCSWELVDDPSVSTFTNDITPLMLASHKNNYEIIKLLLDKGFTLTIPHHIKCKCNQCFDERANDLLCHSRSRINAYQALSSPTLIGLTTKDPLLTAFQLSLQLKNLSDLETEFRVEYIQIREKVQNFAVCILDHVRTFNELMIILNYDHKCEDTSHNYMKFERLKLAIDYKQKKFVAHPIVQLMLATVWFNGMPGFKRRGILGQIFEVLFIALKCPLYSLSTLLIPNSKLAKSANQPFIKFINHSVSYCFFLLLLIITSQNLESLIIKQINNKYLPKWLLEAHNQEKGNLPKITEWIVIMYVLGFIWQEITELWKFGIKQYFHDMWNIVDLLISCFFIGWIIFKFISYASAQDVNLSRDQWDSWDPIIISEGMFGAAMILSFLNMVHIFSVHPNLGPLQISLGRMVYDIIKFFFIYMLVLFAFAFGLNQFLWHYSMKDKQICAEDIDESLIHPKGALDIEHSCMVWRRFISFFETVQTLFWASFGLIELENIELQGIKEFARFWALLMFGTYSVINIVVLLNMLIAMMSTSYQIITERSDIEWKFARSKLWIKYFDNSFTSTLPSPFNIIAFFCSYRSKPIDFIFDTFNMRTKTVNKEFYEKVMRCLVRRYVTHEQKKMEETGPVNEDHVREIKQDIDCFKYELLDLLKYNGMKSKQFTQFDKIFGKKKRIRERRLLKGLSIGEYEFLRFDKAIRYENMLSDHDLMRSSTRKRFWPTLRNVEPFQISQQIQLNEQTFMSNDKNENL